MRTSLALLRLRQQLDSLQASPNDWGDVELISFLNSAVESVVLSMTQADEEWHNYTFDLLATSARQLASNIWEYTLPPWVMRISQIREITASGTAAVRGQEVDPITRWDDGPGFEFSGLYALKLTGYAAAKDIRIHAAKRPARLIQGALPDQTGMTSAQLRLDADPAPGPTTIYPHETIANTYANALFETTGIDVPASHIVSGQLRRCIASAHRVLQAGALYTVLTFDTAWTVAPAILDTYETLLEIPQELSELVILRAAAKAWTQSGNKDELAAMARDLMRCEQALIKGAQPRQVQAPRMMRRSISTRNFTPRSSFDEDLSVVE